MTSKLSVDQGYALLTNLFKHWTFREYSLEQENEFLDDFLREHGRYVFERSLCWEKGLSNVDVANWICKENLDQLRLRYYDHDIELIDLEGICKLVLEITKKIIQPFIDLDIPEQIFKSKEITREVVDIVASCPNCQNDFKIYNLQHADSVTCPVCFLRGKIV